MSLNHYLPCHSTLAICWKKERFTSANYWITLSGLNLVCAFGQNFCKSVCCTVGLLGVAQQCTGREMNVGSGDKMQ